ncbi:MAG: vesicle-fusion atpase [Satyrvirus sp.]|uniref:Vesicle-fusion atpase n=1 Tax=Satyrvirus sp. TaxID=2487771 RepID=A0A3G5AF20_9VIRU|nr:MAG: vesicle-fusion atpase [Satyrvirus sp.]
MVEYTIQIAKSINSELAAHNVIYFKSLPMKTDHQCPCYLLLNKKYIKIAKQLNMPEMRDNCLYLNNHDRKILNVALGDSIVVSPIQKPVSSGTLVISIMNKSNKTGIIHVNEFIEMTLKNVLVDTVVNIGSTIPFYANELYNANVISIADTSGNELSCLLVRPETEIIIFNNDKKIFKINLTSIDFEKIGIGGLEKEFKELINNIFLTRIIPDKIFKKLNIKHTKGAIMYGPPGCGKTRLARKLGSLIGCTNIKIVNGPELLNKYVGESEKNVRECFETAKNNPSELHLLIFDEFDAIASKRSSADSNYTDKVVGQLLSMLDGIEEIDNLIVFALTNRLDIIDPAVLRPGRFSVHIKIDLPDLKGRYEILKIHSKGLIDNKLFSPDLDLMEIAKLAECFTGAELESLVQKTVHEVLGNKIDFNNIVESAKKVNDIIISPNDFVTSLHKINPIFKNKNKIRTELSGKIVKKIDDLVQIENEIITFINSKTYPTVCCINGIPKSGKTSLVCDIAIKIGIENVEYVAANSLLGMAEKYKIDYLCTIFSKSIPCLVILDNIEMVVEFVSEVIFNKNILNTIKILLNETKHNVIITTSYYSVLKSMTLLDSVDKTVEIDALI